jgi:hypothetical protein
MIQLCETLTSTLNEIGRTNYVDIVFDITNIIINAL